MPFDIVPIIKISETGHITVDNAEAMPLRMYGRYRRINTSISSESLSLPPRLLPGDKGN